ncbi:UDP-glucuronate 4-epimerase [Trichlorobacter thiogenes]|uniref:UDP-glucuronate 4-epimerase n=1 Tax=Trichlorobacter thiogenes TaxID=115783 RepID=A0A1T4QI97_9BACT|nr:NAD-dependent epimerase [Trichlorobacter thiogenes]SKA03211.1 UDP-glucuronate 4-epimerase [Trichlorobacter thiogenes]
MKILVTGAAGFIGYHLSKKLIEAGHQVIGLDNINNYYDIELKYARLSQLNPLLNFRFINLGLEDRDKILQLFAIEKFDFVVNLAAQAGVRYSLINPHAYIDSNISGFINILEGCRHNSIKHLIYASSSSVYGANTTIPFSVHHNTDHPVSLYATTKKSNELMAHTYSSLFDIPATGLRFFTVYGPWGRPDMAYFSFTKAILEGEPINVYNYGKMYRDFTYIDDIVEGLIRVIANVPQRNTTWNSAIPDPATSYAPYRIYNIGNNNPIELMRFIKLLEERLGKRAKINLLPLQSGDVLTTYADVDNLIQDIGFHPNTSIEDGIAKFVDWYKAYYCST